MGKERERESRKINQSQRTMGRTKKERRRKISIQNQKILRREQNKAKKIQCPHTYCHHTVIIGNNSNKEPERKMGMYLWPF